MGRAHGQQKRGKGPNPENGEQEPGIGWAYINKEFTPPLDLNTD